MIGFAMALAAQTGLYVRGDYLLQQCSGTARQQEWCLGYITGVVDGMGAIQTLDKSAWVCVPPSIDDGGMRDLVVRYLRTQPGHLKAHAGMLIWAAVYGAYPCSSRK